MNVPAPATSPWGARLAGLLRAVTVAWTLWFLCLAAMFSVPVGSRTVASATFGASISVSVLFYLGHRVFGPAGPLLGAAYAGCIFSAALSGFLLVLFTYVAPAAGRVGWMIAFAGLFATMVLLSLVRIVYQLLAEVQTRLGELLLMLLFMGLLMTLAVTCAPLPEDRVLRSVLTVVYLVPPVLLAAGGATWSWRVARMLGEERARYRINLMFIGWLRVLGLNAAFVLVFCLIAAVANGFRPLLANSGLLWLTLGSLAGTACLWPAFSVQRRAKLAAAERAADGATSFPHRESPCASASSVPPW